MTREAAVAEDSGGAGKMIWQEDGRGRMVPEFEAAAFTMAPIRELHALIVNGGR